MRRLLLSIFILGNLASSFGATYYVSNEGLDSNDGISTQTSWQTLDRMNSEPFQPGDTILFKRGDIWRGQIFPKSGSEGFPITYGAFGSGEKPLFLGSVEKNNPEDWFPEGNNIWATTNTLTIPPGSSELLINPSFTENSLNWSLYYENEAEALGERDFSIYHSAPASYRVDCINSGTLLSDIQLYTYSFSMKKNRIYQLTFHARSNVPFNLKAPVLMKYGSPWNTYYSECWPEYLSISTSWSTYLVNYLSNTTADDGRLTFFLGEDIPEGASFYLDTLSLLEYDTSGVLVCDVGNIIFNNEALCGWKVWNETDLDTQGEFWYDEENRVLKLYSTSSPALYYSDLECALTRFIIPENNTSFVIYEDLALKYGGAHGIGGGNTHHIIVRRCDISFIGGGDLFGGDSTIRFGNGVEFWGNAHDNLVERCRLWDIYDAALTNQNQGQIAEQRNIIYRYNLIWNSEYSFEYWNRPFQSVTENIFFENNTCFHAGYGWGHTQRPDKSGRHLCFYQNPAQTQNFYIRNNIFSETTGDVFYVLLWPELMVKSLMMDNNCWYQSVGDMIHINFSSYNMAEFSQYQSDWGLEPNSIATDPLLVNPENRNFHLMLKSPCIDAGLETGMNEKDFEGTDVPQGNGFDIGAYEFYMDWKIRSSLMSY